MFIFQIIALVLVPFLSSVFTVAAPLPLIPSTTTATAATANINMKTSVTFHLLSTGKVFSDAASACQAEGMTLAKVNNKNWKTAVMAQGVGNKVWIASWNGDSYQGACLAMSNSGIAIPETGCSGPLPVLCSMKTTTSTATKETLPTETFDSDPCA